MRIRKIGKKFAIVQCREAIMRQASGLSDDAYGDQIWRNAHQDKESILAFSGAKINPRGNGWYYVLGYHYAGADLDAVIERLLPYVANKKEG